jgi:5'-3' exonuclease
LCLPLNLALWNKIWELFKSSFNNNTTYKDVRDELLNYNHPEVLIDELLFFENGVFKFGKLDEDQKIADDVIRRILIPLASSDSKYIDILIRNVSIIKKIIDKANDALIEFRTALDSKCPTIFDDLQSKPFIDLLVEKSDALTKEPLSENQNRGGKMNNRHSKFSSQFPWLKYSR